MDNDKKPPLGIDDFRQAFVYKPDGRLGFRCVGMFQVDADALLDAIFRATDSVELVEAWIKADAEVGTPDDSIAAAIKYVFAARAECLEIGTSYTAYMLDEAPEVLRVLMRNACTRMLEVIQADIEQQTSLYKEGSIH